MKRFAVVILCALALAACSDEPDEVDAIGGDQSLNTPSSSTETTPTPQDDSGNEDALEESVNAYSDAFLKGEPRGAYELLSSQCQDDTSLAKLTGIIAVATDIYEPEPIDSFEADVDGQNAVVSYTYADQPDIDQGNERWVLEGDGIWRNDDC